MLATEEDAMAWRSSGFSFSRLKGLDLTFLPFLSDRCFEDLEVGKIELEERPDEVEVKGGLNGWRTGDLGTSGSSVPKGSSVAPCSVSWRTFDASRRAGFFR